ncbi:MAG: hypothetical protein ACUVWP_06335 [bacterium]
MNLAIEQNIIRILNPLGSITILTLLVIIFLIDIFIRKKNLSTALSVSSAIIIVLISIFKLLFKQFTDTVILYSILFNAGFGFRFLPSNLVFLSLITTIFVLLRAITFNEKKWRYLSIGYVLIIFALLSRTLIQFLIFLSLGIFFFLLHIIMNKYDDKGAVRRAIFVIGTSILLLLVSSGLSVYYGVVLSIKGFIIQHNFSAFIATLLLSITSFTFMGVPLWRNWLPSIENMPRTSVLFIETLLFIIGGVILINLGKSIERTSYIILFTSIVGTIPGTIIALKSERKDIISYVRGTLGAIAGVGIGLGYSSSLRGAEIIILIGALSTALSSIFLDYKGIYTQVMLMLSIAPISLIVPLGVFRGLSLIYYGISHANHFLTYLTYITITITQAILILALFRLLTMRDGRGKENKGIFTIVISSVAVPLLYLTSIYTKYISFGYFYAGQIKIYPTPDIVPYFSVSPYFIIPSVGALSGIILSIISLRSLDRLRDDGGFITNIKPVPFFFYLRQTQYLDLYNLSYGAIRISSFILAEILDYLILIFEKPSSFLINRFNAVLKVILAMKEGNNG